MKLYICGCFVYISLARASEKNALAPLQQVVRIIQAQTKWQEVIVGNN